MSDCIDILRSIGATCASINQVGGVDKRVWVTQLNQIESYTFDSDGYINSLVTKQIGSTNYQYQLAKIVGKKNTHSGTYEGVVGDNVNILKQTAILKIYTDSPSDRDKVIDLFDARELVVFFENANGFIEVYGLDKGLDGSALSGGTGVALQDDTVVTVTLSGDQNKLPYYFLVGGSLATSIDYLDSIGFSPIYLIQSYTAGRSSIDFTNNGGDDWDIDFKIAMTSIQLPSGCSAPNYYANVFFYVAGGGTPLNTTLETTDKTVNVVGYGAGVYKVEQIFNVYDSSSTQVGIIGIQSLFKVDGSGTLLAYFKCNGVTVNSVNGLDINVTADVSQSENYDIEWYSYDSSFIPTLIGTGLAASLTLPTDCAYLIAQPVLDSVFTVDFSDQSTTISTITIN